MKKSNMKKVIGFFLIGLLMFSTVGCASSPTPEPSETTPSVEEPANHEQVGQETEKVADFAIKLFQENLNDTDDTLISPFSLLCALAMTANGAEEETLAQMEQTMGLSLEQLNAAATILSDRLQESDRSQLHLANAIWVNEKESFQANPDFLATNSEVYQSELHQIPFDDQTASAINDWVAQETNGKIEEILKDVPENAIMYLVNALAFDAEWEEIYQENQIQEGTFTQADGTVQTGDFMYSKEHQYMEDENATGFIKSYAGGQYAFAALLPKEGQDLATYVRSLDGQTLQRLFDQAQEVTVNAAIPKFQSEYDVEMSESLKAMGMQDAFDPDQADFSGLGTSSIGNIYISQVLHKTFIAVDERGTEAGAATVVEMVEKTSLIDPEEVKTVYLDRPFVYMIMDCETQLPLFIGTVTGIE